MDPHKLSAQELVQLCLDSKDEASWTEFVRRFQPLLAGVVTKCLFHRTRRVSPALIDDLVQEAYIKLIASHFKALRKFDFRHENAFFGFLKVVASHVVEDHFRKPTPDRPGREEEDIETLKIAPTSKHGIEQSELEILLREVDECLAEHASDPNFTRDHTIFWLYYRQGLTAKAISQLPGIDLNVKGVESVLMRLICQLRARLAIPRKRRASGR
jgi:RNA polymerase sigma-70 factor (ECF subfamily)